HGAAQHRVLWFTAREVAGARTRLVHEAFEHADQCGLESVEQLAGNCCAAIFPAFTREVGPDGFAFLHERMLRGHDDGPILISMNNRRIVGAIGPLSTLTDAAGVCFLSPPYFAVHPEHRGQGHGRALRRAAVEWGRRHGAVYQVLQAASGSAAEHLYLSEGFSTLGFLHTTGERH
ncbi:MAG TPA: GNAT family N-acetyltransferase, partial [Mycobacteriales bacterium]|nr:GNAT family N-acetyltransferase [Mycobacteriales bacterium]